MIIPVHAVDGDGRPLKNAWGVARVFTLPDDMRPLQSRRTPELVHLTDQFGKDGWFFLSSLREIKKP